MLHHESQADDVHADLDGREERSGVTVPNNRKRAADDSQVAKVSYKGKQQACVQHLLVTNMWYPLHLLRIVAASGTIPSSKLHVSVLLAFGTPA